MEEHLVDRFALGGEKLQHAIRGLTPEDLLATPIAGMWSTQKVVLHLLDSDLVFIDRMKRIIAEDNPPLIAFDENKFVTELFYDEQPAEDAAALLDLSRKLFVRVLRKLPASAFSRVGTHSQRGPMTLQQVLTLSVTHFDHHLQTIADKREKLGKLMW